MVFILVGNGYILISEQVLELWNMSRVVKKVLSLNVDVYKRERMTKETIVVWQLAVQPRRLSPA